MEALFGRLNADDFREYIFRLCYSQHGGSGLSFTYESVMEMPLSDFQWFVDRLEEARQDESSAIRAANAKAARGRR